MYAETKARYKLENIDTDWEKNEEGVQQGFILSTILFNMYTEELEVRLRRKNA